MTLTPLAVALQGIGYGEHLTALQGLAEAAGGSGAIVCESIVSAEAFGEPRVEALSSSHPVSFWRGHGGMPPRRLRIHVISGVGNIASANAVGRPAVTAQPMVRSRAVREAELFALA